MVEYGGAKLVSCPGRYLTSLRPYLQRLLDMCCDYPSEQEIAFICRSVRRQLMWFFP